MNAVVVMIVLLTKLFFCLCHQNNVCATFDDYYTIKNNPKCWYDPAAVLNTTDLIRAYGYPLEIHKVQTPDRFILSLFRIPNRDSKRPILLQHGLMGSASNFLGAGRDSLALLLHDAGYDVWLLNYRGSEYSESHVYLTVNDKKFWDHSLDDIASYDIPAVIKRISYETGQKGSLIFIGHSLGTTIGLMYASAFPEEAKNNIKFMLLLCPVYTLTKMKTPYKYVAPLTDTITNAINEFGVIRLTSQLASLRPLIRSVCLESPDLMKICIYFFLLFCGLNNQTGPKRIPVFFNQLPGGTSTKVLKHTSDFVKNRFAKYDYGPTENFRKYGSYESPIYDVKKIGIPTYIMYSVADWATTKKDSLNLYNTLSKNARYGIYEVRDKNFNHADFIFGRNVKEILYDKLLSVLDKVS